MPVLFTSLFQKKLLLVVFILVTIFWFSCKKESKTPSLTGITSFGLLQDSSVVVQSTNVIKGDSILITVPGTTNISALTTRIALGAGETISPASGVQEDFIQPVNYTVTLLGGTIKNYIVKVTLNKLENIVYVGTGDGALYAMDALTGKNFWVQTTNGDFSYSSPAYANGIVYAGNINGNMYAFTGGLGNYLWTYKTGSSIESSPLVSGGNVYFGSDDYYFYALNAQTGTLAWKFLTGFNVSSSPLIYNGIVYFGSDDGNFYALDAITGGVKWKYYTASIFNASSPVALNGVIYVGDRNGDFFALDAISGQVKWTFSSGGVSFEMARPIIANGIIYVASWYSVTNFSMAGSLYALNAVTGAQVWMVLPNTGFSSGPASDNNELFISADGGKFYALDQSSGSVLWSSQILPNGAIPVGKSGIVYVGGGGTGYFYALDEITGAVKWNYNVGSLDMSRPYVIDANGN